MSSATDANGSPRVARSYLAIVGMHTLAASLIWGVSTPFPRRR